MKKIFSFSAFAVLISFTSVHAQVTKGSLFLGGNISFYSSHDDADNNSISYKQDVFIFSPVAGKAIKDNLVFGVALLYSYSKYGQEINNAPNDQKSYGYGASLFLRNYKPIGRGFYIYLESSLGGRYDKSANDPLTAFNNYKRTSVTLGVTPGISYAVSKKLHLELGFNQALSVGYSHETGDKGFSLNIPYKINSFSASTNFNNSYLSSIYFGFRLFLGK